MMNVHGDIQRFQFMQCLFIFNSVVNWWWYIHIHRYLAFQVYTHTHTHWINSVWAFHITLAAAIISIESATCKHQHQLECFCCSLQSAHTMLLFRIMGMSIFNFSSLLWAHIRIMCKHTGCAACAVCVCMCLMMEENVIGICVTGLIILGYTVFNWHFNGIRSSVNSHSSQI